MLKINIIGSIFGSSGYDSHTRSLANALYKIADCRLSTQMSPDWMKHVSDSELDMITKDERKDDYNLIIAMPHMWKMFTGLGKNIGYCVWEGDRVPSSWIDEFLNPKIDFIFVPSTHTYNAIINTAANDYEKDRAADLRIEKKLIIIPHGCDRNIFHSQQSNPDNALPSADKGALTKPVQNVEAVSRTDGRRFIFLINKGWRGTHWDRGGVQYVIKAFAEEFKKDENVKLEIKLNPAYINPQHIEQAILALNLPEDRAPIHINCNTLPFDKLPDLYRQADCYVCATRAESFDLGTAEAMSCGLPCLTSGYGGQIEHMIENENALFFDYDMIEVKEDIMYENISWCIPKIEDIKKKMRWMFNNQEKAKQMGINAEQFIDNNFTWDKSAEKVINSI